MSQFRRKRLRGGQPGPKPLKLSEIPVIGPRGERLNVYVREFRVPVPFSQTEKKQVAYELSTANASNLSIRTRSNQRTPALCFSACKTELIPLALVTLNASISD